MDEEQGVANDILEQTRNSVRTIGLPHVNYFGGNHVGQEGQRKKNNKDGEGRYEERDNEETRANGGEANNDTL